MLALFGNLDFSELVLAAAVAVILFGKRLPEVAMRAAAQFVKFRRALAQMWRDAGLEDELRRVRREVEYGISEPRRADPSEPFGRVRRPASGASGGAREPERSEPAELEPPRPEPRADEPTDGGDGRESA